MLTEMQKDVLGEIVNVYIGQAASLLSEMTGQEIRLNVPQVLLLVSRQQGRPPLMLARAAE